MKKIILAFDGTNFPEGAFEHARSLDKLRPILLTGVFFTTGQLSNSWNYADGMYDAKEPITATKN